MNEKRVELWFWLLAPVLALAVLFWALSPTVYADGTVIYVDTDAPGPVHDGLSWTTAYTTVQAALDWTKTYSTTSYEIWVAEGVYYPDEGSSHVSNAVTETFRINYNNVQLYGGFAGYGISETVRTQRDWTAHPTVLSGDIDANDTNTDGNRIAETWIDLQGNNAYHVLYLDGVTNQSITGTTKLDGFIVTAGNANGGGQNFNGGGLYCWAHSSGHACSPTLTNLTFSGNWATYDGGGMCNDGNTGVSSPSLTNVTFSGNLAINDGGGMCNFGDNGGASSPVLTKVTFSDNRAQGSGGGMYNDGWNGVSSPTLTNVTFSNNKAFYHGGGMFNNVYNGGASSPVLTNVTFSGNSTTLGYGGGMFNNGSSPQVHNSILWGDSPDEVYNDMGSTPVISYSLVQGGYITGTAILDNDPLFVEPVSASTAPTTTGNLRLRFGSPAIDAGDPDTATLPLTDLDGNPRVMGRAVDMGAYEHFIQVFLPLVRR
jgi:hypothetical protein